VNFQDQKVYKFNTLGGGSGMNFKDLLPNSMAPKEIYVANREKFT